MGQSMTFSIPGFDLDAFVAATLAEDLGEGLPGGGHDVTSESVIPAQARFSGVMDSRDPTTVAGLPIAAAFFRWLDPAVEIDILVEEGQAVPADTDLMRLTGNARAAHRRAQRAQHRAAPLGHRHDDASIRRRDAG